jgi:hypothetical protein
MVRKPSRGWIDHLGDDVVGDFLGNATFGFFVGQTKQDVCHSAVYVEQHQASDFSSARRSRRQLAQYSRWRFQESGAVWPGSPRAGA